MVVSDVNYEILKARTEISGRYLNSYEAGLTETTNVVSVLY